MTDDLGLAPNPSVCLLVKFAGGMSAFSYGYCVFGIPADGVNG